MITVNKSFCPFCGRGDLTLITTSAPGEKSSEKRRCNACGVFFTISDVTKEEKPAGILVRYTGISGEAEFTCSTLIPYNGKAPAEKVIRDYFSDFFSEGTRREDCFYYVSRDGGQAVKITGWSIVPQADYAVLEKYL
ncbi:MAG: hypothetical protein ACUVSK_13415 [Desulfotomaculales bacterium]